MEYHALKALINNINREVESKTEMSRLKIDALATKLHWLILRDAMALASEKAAALIESGSAPEPYEEQRQLTMKELADVALAAGSRACLFAMTQEWADDAAMLLLEILVRKAAIQTVQKKYYDGHAILNRGIEEALESTIQLILETVATFNEYLSTKPNGFTQDDETTIDHETSPLRIDVEAIRERASKELVDYLVSTWVTEAQENAIADILEETNEHGNFIWERFRSQVGAES